MFFVADIGCFLRTLSDKIAYLCVRSTKVLQVLQCQAAAFYKKKQRCSSERLDRD